MFGVFDVAFFEFVVGADIKEDGVFCADQRGELIGIDTPGGFGVFICVRSECRHPNEKANYHADRYRLHILKLVEDCLHSQRKQPAKCYDACKRGLL
jgi:hypothetical protein